MPRKGEKKVLTLCLSRAVEQEQNPLSFAPEKIDGDRVQQVDIYLKFIGRFELPPAELTPEEEKRQATLKGHWITNRERYRM